MEMKPKIKGPKMMQVNVLDQGKGKLTINIRRQGFSDPEMIGILEMAKSQIQRMMRSNVEQRAKFNLGLGKDDNKAKKDDDENK